ncbi:FAD-dependent oxidoreductase [Paraferrimonas sp. SM1919]|uniref:FAD-dependent oxidoreductase n=1 Tax=Paraferrimonas sp. SM1919 TaxID=2662263 RepID=UPI0013D67271|nr:FAD-dependent oxidoreductase [Paraferrimonas sp. SM1919]
MQENDLVVDVVIIGGGALGAATALRAQTQGLRVCVLEQGQVGEQTSANSSKLIHGGLRYLESLQFGLVKECLRARKRFIADYPQLVTMNKFYIPVYKYSKRPAWLVKIGLYLYQWLANDSHYGGFKTLNEQQWSEIGAINQQQLVSVFQYWDAQTDDKQLTQQLLNDAVAKGTKLFTQTRFDGLTEAVEGESLVKVVAVDCQTKTRQHIRCSYVVNCSGPWVNQVLSKINEPSVSVEFVQGSHLQLDCQISDGIVYLESVLDNRVLFIIPWKGQTLLGTTEISLGDNYHNHAITVAEQNYLIDNLLHYYPQLGSRQEILKRITRTYSGVRVLPKIDAQSVFSRSRDTLMVRATAYPNFISVFGGKLTTVLIEAEKLVAMINQQN